MMFCKICLEDSETIKENILENICACKGSSQSVHKKCLLEWLNVKQIKKAKPSFCCEICLSEYQIVATHKKIFRIKRFLEQERSEITAWTLMAFVFLVFLCSVNGHNFMIPMFVCIGFCVNICKFCVVEFITICVSYEIINLTTQVDIRIQ